MENSFHIFQTFEPHIWKQLTYKKLKHTCAFIGPDSETKSKKNNEERRIIESMAEEEEEIYIYIYSLNMPYIKYIWQNWGVGG